MRPVKSHDLTRFVFKVFFLWAFWINRHSSTSLLIFQAMCKGGQSREALPSSDAAVMAANCFLLWKFWHHPIAPFLATLLFLLACFGRILEDSDETDVKSGLSGKNWKT